MVYDFCILSPTLLRFTATVADGSHPTVMHSCFQYVSLSDVKKKVKCEHAYHRRIFCKLCEHHEQQDFRMTRCDQLNPGVLDTMFSVKNGRNRHF